MTKYDENQELENLCKMMEEIANLPRDNTPHVRQPGERGSYEMYQERLQRSKLSTEQA